MGENFIAPAIELDQKRINIRLAIPLEEDSHALGMGVRGTEKCLPIVGSLLPFQDIRQNFVDAATRLTHRANDTCGLQAMLGCCLDIALEIVRASGGEWVFQSVEIPVVAVVLKKKNN